MDPLIRPSGTFSPWEGEKEGVHRAGTLRPIAPGEGTRPTGEKGWKARAGLGWRGRGPSGRGNVRVSRG
jgi:hypothetical protein